MKWDGLAELKSLLQKLPTHLADEARGIVLDAATTAAENIVRDYPEKTGHLRAGVSVKTFDPSQFGAAAIVINRAKHAFIFENGTQIRKNNRGANRGAMPPGRVFIPNVMRERKKMYVRLKDMLEREGLEVKGDA